MPYTPRLRAAVRFAIRTHEVDQKQKRKGKDVAYITHPLTVGLILLAAGAGEDVAIAGLLHDTVEDSAPRRKVTNAMVAARFGKRVAALVADVTEETDHRKVPTWEARKEEMLARIKRFSHDAVLVKSADVISNATEIVDDHREAGDAVWRRFERPKAVTVAHHGRVIKALLARWPKSPLAGDLRKARRELNKI